VGEPVLTDLFSFCYMLYFLYLIIGQFSYLFGDLAVFEKITMRAFSLCTRSGISGIPWFPRWALRREWATNSACRSAEAGSRREQKIVLGGRQRRRRRFPSLHCGNASTSCYRIISTALAILGLFDTLPSDLWLSTLYLRYSLLHRVACGLLLGWLAWKMANRYLREQPGHEFAFRRKREDCRTHHRSVGGHRPGAREVFRQAQHPIVLVSRGEEKSSASPRRFHRHMECAFS